MKAKDTATLGVIRLIRSSFANAAIDLKTEKLSDEQVRLSEKLMKSSFALKLSCNIPQIIFVDPRGFCNSSSPF